MNSSQTVAFILDEFALQTPSQQLLDRFLIGYPWNGGFRPPAARKVAIHSRSAPDHPEILRRRKEFGLLSAASVPAALSGAGAVIVAGAAIVGPSSAQLREVLEQLAPDQRCFVYGSLAGADFSEAKKIFERAAARGLVVVAGTAMLTSLWFPDVPPPHRAAFTEALAVVQGTFPTAELEGIEALLPTLEKGAHSPAGIKRIRFLGPEACRDQSHPEWPVELLAAASSRSNTPQGDALRDGRTQDLVGLGLVQKLAKDPRGWLIEDRNGVRWTILVLNGVVADVNVAFRTKQRATFSAQLYRPPLPGQHHFNGLAFALEEFFRSGKPPWNPARAVLIAGLLGAFQDATGRDGWIETPHLDFREFLPHPG